MTQGPIIRAASPLVAGRICARLSKGAILFSILPLSVVFGGPAQAQYGASSFGAFQPLSGGANGVEYPVGQPTIIPFVPGAEPSAGGEQGAGLMLSPAETAIGLMPANQFLMSSEHTGSPVGMATIVADTSHSYQPSFQVSSQPQATTALDPAFEAPDAAFGSSTPIPAASEFLDPPGVNSPFGAQADGDHEQGGLRSQVNSALEPLEGFASDIAGTVKQSADRSRRAFGQQAQKGVDGYIGAGVHMAPFFAGSNVYEFSPVAIGDVTFAELLRWRHDEGLEFIPFAQLPVDFAIGMDWRVGRKGRHVPDGIDDVDGGIELGFELAIPIADTEIFADAERGLMGDNLGWSFETGVRTAGIKVNRRGEVNASISTTWLDASAMATEFAVSNAEAASSGLSAYAVDSGLRDVTADLELMFFMNDRLGVYAGAQAGVLIEQAAKSPIVSDEGSPLQLSSRLGLIYQF